jgi:hypothetical protein
MFSDEWHALGREGQLAAEQIAVGITALGAANHAQPGIYIQAFFGLSIGLERLAKLILVADHAIDHSGAFPTNDELKNIGHHIGALLNRCADLSEKYRAGEPYCERPADPIHEGIILCLTEFGVLSRYYNLDLIAGGKARRLPEPIAAWWSRVGRPILARHYSDRQRAKDAAQSAAMAELFGPVTSVLRHTEDQTPITDIATLMTHGGATRIVQKYGRLYVFQLVRWLAFLMTDLSHAAHGKGIEAFYGLNEPFALFLNDDSYFLGRKSWSIYRP